ncbi:DUF58 domain-containing protein [Candidatus Woesearchaeota archaeon]|nr:DUF58 domain-containing protein [Candidatus Woesearchaeota archaeon]RLE41921.1 MAG: DUF58 domain-containing protein [Candidatus Woesearchaeota archaeon]
METKEIIRQVKRIEITTRHLVDTLIAGKYHSVFKGRGLEFSELREYQPGDDIRAIDWKVTARFNHPFVKVFTEERDLRVYFAFDFSGSSQFGDMVAKKRKGIEIAATLMFSAIRNNDNVGLVVFTDRVERFVPARKGRKHVLKLISVLVTHQPSSTLTDLNTPLKFLASVVKKRSIIFIISDFRSIDFTKPLQVLRGKHDIIAIRVYDRREIELPDVGLIQLEDEETGEQILVNTSDEDFRERFKAIVERENQRLRQMLRRLRIDLLEVATDEPYEVPLKRFFKKREVLYR